MCDLFFFFKQKTAYEMRISDWSSDVCSSDLPARSRVLPQKDKRGDRRSPAAALQVNGTRPELRGGLWDGGVDLFLAQDQRLDGRSPTGGVGRRPAGPGGSGNGQARSGGAPGGRPCVWPLRRRLCRLPPPPGQGPWMDT